MLIACGMVHNIMAVSGESRFRLELHNDMVGFFVLHYSSTKPIIISGHDL